MSGAYLLNIIYLFVFLFELQRGSFNVIFQSGAAFDKFLLMHLSMFSPRVTSKGCLSHRFFLGLNSKMGGWRRSVVRQSVALR